MRNIFLFLGKHYFIFLFLILEAFAFSIIFKNNQFQRAWMINSSNAIVGNLMSVINNITEYFSLRTENIVLGRENARLYNERLANFRKVSPSVAVINDTMYHQKYEYVHARVVNNSFNKRNNFLTLDKGRNDGIERDMAVITTTGVVGIVKEVSMHFSSVISVLHKETKVSSKIKKSGYIGSLEWDGRNYKYGNLKDIPTHIMLQKGDTIVTSGYSSIFPEGILIGTIQDFSTKSGDSFYNITVRFTTEFNRLSHVYVIRNFYHKEQDELEKTTQHD